MFRGQGFRNWKKCGNSVINKCGKYSYLPGVNIITSAIHGLNPGQYTKLLRITVRSLLDERKKTRQVYKCTLSGFGDSLRLCDGWGRGRRWRSQAGGFIF